jgi:hypothetical protein
VRCGLLSPAIRQGPLQSWGKTTPPGERQRLHFHARHGEGGTGASASSRTPGDARILLASYLEKLRDFPPGQILLGIVGVHGCAARTLGRRGRGSWAAATRAGARAGGVRAALGQPLLQSATLGLAAQAREPQPVPRGYGLRAPAASATALVPAPELLALSGRAASTGASRQRARQGRERGAEAGGERGGRQAAARQAPALRGAPLPRARSAVAASHAVRAGARGGPAVTPLGAAP